MTQTVPDRARGRRRDVAQIGNYYYDSIAEQAIWMAEGNRIVLNVLIIAWNIDALQ